MGEILVQAQMSQVWAELLDYGKFKLHTKSFSYPTSGINASIFMEHAHPSYAHMVLQMSLTQIGSSSTKILCPNPAPMWSLFPKAGANKCKQNLDSNYDI
jgi:hypothetical protein